MHLNATIRALPLIPAEPTRAVTASEFASAWVRSGGDPKSRRQLYRYISALERENLVTAVEAENGHVRYHRSTGWWLR